MFIILKKEIQKIKDSLHQFYQESLLSTKKTRENITACDASNRPASNDSKNIHPPLQKRIATNNHEIIVSICRNKASKKYFIYLKDIDQYHSEMITPEGKTISLSNDLFDEIEEERLSILIGTNRLSVKQIKAFEFTNPEVKVVLSKEDEGGGRELGSKGNENLKDYLIPVLQLIYDGYDYKDAFHIVKDHLDVRYNTVSAQCTRSLGLTTDEFVRTTKDKSIIQLLKNKYSDREDLINSELTETIMG